MLLREVLDKDTLVPVGAVVAAGGVFYKAAKWLLDLNAKVDMHTDQLDHVEKALKSGQESRTALHEKVNNVEKAVSALEATTKGIDNKIDLVLEKLLK